MHFLRGHCCRGLGTLSAKIGQIEQACRKLTTAIEMYQSMDVAFWLPQTEAALVQVAAR